MRNVLVRIACAAVLICGILICGGWHNAGHESIVIISGKVIEGKVPSFFTNNIRQVAHSSIDPDIFKEKLNDQALRRAEYPDHFFDLEYFTEDELPLDRYEFAEWCFKHDLKPGKVGTLPYSLTEYTQKLIIAFAEYRKWPDNKYIQSKCLVYAGVLAHYSGDAGMPLHATKDYDGRTKPGSDEKEMKGIHLKLDALIEKIPQDKLPDPGQIKIARIPGKILPAVFEFIKVSNQEVPDVYKLYAGIPQLNERTIEDEKVLDAAKNMLSRSVSLTAGLYFYAWEASKEVQIPEWHKRQY